VPRSKARNKWKLVRVNGCCPGRLPVPRSQQRKSSACIGGYGTGTVAVDSGTVAAGTGTVTVDSGTVAAGTGTVATAC
jgi:hypothetical protein